MADKKQMYQNPILEILSISSPQMMIPFHLLVATTFIYFGIESSFTPSILTGVFIFFAGVVFWTFAEYALHRWVFHFVNDSKIIKNIHYAVHGYHHSEPKDSNRLFMPPVPALLLLLFFFGVFYLVMGEAAWFFLPGFEMGYLMYSLFHYLIHTRKPTKRWKHLWLHHTLHHHKYPDLAFGVSNTFWDRVFGTMPPKRKINGKV